MHKSKTEQRLISSALDGDSRPRPAAAQRCFTPAAAASSFGWPRATDSSLSQPRGQTEPHLSKPPWEQRICMGPHPQTVSGGVGGGRGFTQRCMKPTLSQSHLGHAAVDWWLTVISQPHHKSTEKWSRQVLVLAAEPGDVH
ncbi:uncharacterized protein V6R79_021514 [Siganus canaliculatus]